MKQVKTKHQCQKCNFWFSAKGGNYKRHIDSCNGEYSPFKKSVSCKYCGIEFDSFIVRQQIASHVKWCDKNPNRTEYVANTDRMRACITAESRKLAAVSISKAHAEGKYQDSGKKAIETRRIRGNLSHTQETRQIMKEKALASTHRRLKKGTVMYKGILLDSSWEVALAERLDELSINWYRPDPLPWIDKNHLQHNYFPDFYLPEYDLYLDPKNPQAVIAQKEKLEQLLTQYNNIVILHTIKECKNYLPNSKN